jgi:hypothetical protein
VDFLELGVAAELGFFLDQKIRQFLQMAFFFLNPN